MLCCILINLEKMSVRRTGSYRHKKTLNIRNKQIFVVTRVNIFGVNSYCLAYN